MLEWDLMVYSRNRWVFSRRRSAFFGPTALFSSLRSFDLMAEGRWLMRLFVVLQPLISRSHLRLWRTTVCFKPVFHFAREQIHFSSIPCFRLIGFDESFSWFVALVRTKAAQRQPTNFQKKFFLLFVFIVLDCCALLDISTNGSWVDRVISKSSNVL